MFCVDKFDESVTLMLLEISEEFMFLSISFSPY